MAESGRNSLGRTLLVATILSLVCSALVTSVATALRPIQERNEIENRQRNILAVAGLLDGDRPVQEVFDESIEVRLVDLAAGSYAEDLSPADYDPAQARNDPARSVPIPDERDVASLDRREKVAPVYLVRGEDRITSVILPVRGAGLWSTMYGFVALEPDGNTVQGLRFYEHAETPGLGDQIDDPDWQSLWQGKLIYGPAGRPEIEVIRGTVPRDAASSTPPEPGDPVYQVDGLAGATLTARGVTNMLRYWLGEDGFGPYLARHWRQGEA